MFPNAGARRKSILEIARIGFTLIMWVVQPHPMVAQRPDELFDVVDAQDRVIGQATRAEVHARKLVHRAVHIFVFNEAGQVFFQRRSLLKDTAPGKWSSSASGHVDAGEDYDATARREISEELGISANESLQRVVYVKACELSANEFLWVYRMQHEGPFILNEHEVMDGKWLLPDEWNDWIAREPEAFARSSAYVWSLFQKAVSKS